MACKWRRAFATLETFALFGFLSAREVRHSSFDTGCDPSSWAGILCRLLGLCVNQTHFLTIASIATSSSSSAGTVSILSILGPSLGALSGS